MRRSLTSNSLTNLSVLVLLASLATPFCFAQSRFGSGKNDTAKSELHSPEMEYFLAAARRLATESSALDTGGEKALFMIKLSAVMWKEDEVFSRDLLSRSFDLIAALYGEQDEALKGDAQDPTMLFQELIGVAADHDQALGREFERRRDAIIKASARVSRAKSGDQIMMSNVLLSEAARVLRTDEERGRTLLRQSALLYTTQAHLSFLRELRNRSSESADRLFADVLSALSQRPLREANEILVLASYLFSPTQTVNYSLVSGYNAANVSGNLSESPKNPTLGKQYLSLLLSSLDVSETTPATVVYLALNNMLPQFKALAPEAVNEVYGKMSRLKSQIADSDLDSAPDNVDEHPGKQVLSWKQRLKKAEETPAGDRRDLEYFTIIDGYLLPEQDFSNAYALVDRIDNNELRQALSDYIDFSSIKKSRDRLSHSDFPESKYQKISDPLVKALAQCEEAYALHQQNLNHEATLLLEEAIRQSERIAVGQQRVQVKLAVVNSYLDFDVRRAFEVAREAFKDVGKVDDFNIRGNGFTLRIVVYGLRNELPLGISVDSSLASSLRKMCRANCVEALNISQLIPQRSQRLWAALATLSSFLSESKRMTEKRNESHLPEHFVIGLANPGARQSGKL